MGGDGSHDAPEVLGSRAPSNRVAVGIIGLGGRGMVNLDAMFGLEDVVVCVVCDVNRGKAAAAQSRVNRCYGYCGCLAENDFRALCARKDIDAVVISTPDHSHAAIGMEAVRNGKDV